MSSFLPPIHQPQLLTERIAAEHARALDWDDRPLAATPPATPRGIYRLFGIGGTGAAYGIQRAALGASQIFANAVTVTFLPLFWDTPN